MILDNFKSEQPISYKYLINSIRKNKTSHAYIIECNGYTKGYDFSIAFIKFLLCPNHYTNLTNCNNCYQCKIIDNHNFLELKIIEANGQWIKKEQLSELQKDFTRKAVIGGQKIYLIKDAEKMNQAAANSILKFLEEPSPGIIAILLTQNINQLMDTIISRCQIIHLEKDSNNEDKKKKIAGFIFNSQNEINEFLENDAEFFIEFIMEYINYFEKNKYRTIILKNKKYLEIFDDRKKMTIGLQIMILLYQDILNYILDKKLEYFDNIDIIKNISLNNNIDTIYSKIKIIYSVIENINYNVNLNLVLDKLIIKMGDVKSVQNSWN